MFAQPKSGWWFEQRQWPQVKPAVGIGKETCLLGRTSKKEGIHREFLISNSSALQH